MSHRKRQVKDVRIDVREFRSLRGRQKKAHVGGIGADVGLSDEVLDVMRSVPDDHRLLAADVASFLGHFHRIDNATGQTNVRRQQKKKAEWKGKSVRATVLRLHQNSMRRPSAWSS